MTPAGKVTTLHSFSSTTGDSPFSGLIQATDGNFYGTTYYGGNSNSLLCLGTCGSLYKLTSTGKFATLYEFCSQANCADGADPYANLIQGSDGVLYGTTLLGGNASGADGSAGTVFKLSLGLLAGK